MREVALQDYHIVLNITILFCSTCSTGSVKDIDSKDIETRLETNLQKMQVIHNGAVAKR